MNKRIHSRVAILVIAVILFPSLAFAPSFNRQVQITIQVVDADNNLVPGATISYRQTSQDFMFSTGWRWHGESTPPELTERINEIGFNTGHILAFYEWEGVQPEEDVFRWQGLDHAFDTFGTARPVDEELPNLRHRYVSLGPSFGELSPAPGWVNTDDPDTFQRQYGEYLRQFLMRYRGRVNAYSVFGELEGSAHGLSIEETISWARWETGLIREIDPQAVILIQVGDTHWYFPGATEVQIEHATFMPKWRIMEMLIDGGVDFDGFAVETHYSMAAPGDWRQLKEAVETLTAYDKYIYIWESYYPSGYNACVYFNWQERALTPKQVPAEWPYSPETYTEAWQQDQLVNTLRTLVENDRVLGYNYGTLAGATFVDGPTNAPGVGFGEDLCDQPSTISLGLVHSDFSPKPGFTALRDYWRSLFASGEMITDASGEAVFSGMGGEYEIAVFADGYEQQTIRIHVDKSGGNTIQLVVQPQAVAAGEEVEEADDYGYFLSLFVILVFVCGAVLFVVAFMGKRLGEASSRAYPFTFHPMDEVNARAILNWRYDAPYDLYNPGSDDVEEVMQVFLDPQNAYYTITDEHRDLVAHCCFGPDAQVHGGDYNAAALDIGLGMRPDLTGQGRGLTYVNAVLDFARRTFAPTAFRVTVAEFNKRALRVWKKAGFRPVERFQRSQDSMRFVVLALQHDLSTSSR